MEVQWCSGYHPPIFEMLGLNINVILNKKAELTATFPSLTQLALLWFHPPIGCCLLFETLKAVFELNQS